MSKTAWDNTRECIETAHSKLDGNGDREQRILNFLSEVVTELENEDRTFNDHIPLVAVVVFEASVGLEHKAKLLAGATALTQSRAAIAVEKPEDSVALFYVTGLLYPWITLEEGPPPPFIDPQSKRAAGWPTVCVFKASLNNLR